MLFLVLVADFFVLVLVCVNEIVIFSFLVIFVFVFVNENHTDWQVICNVETMGHLQCDGCHRLTVADYFPKYWYFWPSNTKSKPELNTNSEPSTVLTVLT